MKIDTTPSAQLELVDFHWEADSAGYEQLRTDEGYNFLTANERATEHARLFASGTAIIEGKSRRTEDYHPDPNIAVHREFASLQDDTTCFVNFANEWGLPTRATGPESVADLIALRNRLRAVLDAIDRANVAQGPKRQKERMAAAQTFAAHGHPLLSMTLMPALASKNNSPETFKLDGGLMTLKIVPSTLFDYMLLYAAYELQGLTTWRICKGCGRQFRIGPGYSRRDAQTCQEKCRTTKNRRK